MYKLLKEGFLPLVELLLILYILLCISTTDYVIQKHSITIFEKVEYMSQLLYSISFDWSCVPYQSQHILKQEMGQILDNEQNLRVTRRQISIEVPPPRTGIICSIQSFQCKNMQFFLLLQS